MAFCAECGKQNQDQATVCDGCGKPMRTAAKPAGGGAARFKGTMIMGGVTAPKPGAPGAAAPTPTPAPAAAPAPAPAPQPNLAFQATMMGPMTAPGASAPPVAAAPPAAAPPAAAQPAAPRVSPKGTMIGGMGGLQPPIAVPPPASAPSPSPTPAEAPIAASPAAPTFDAPAPAFTPDASPPPAAPSLDIDYSASASSYGSYGAAPTKSGSKTWLWVALGLVGALAFACVGTGLAIYFGAVSFGDKLGGAVMDLARRGQVTVALSGVQAACASGNCAAAAESFHPSVRDKLLAQAPTVSPAVIAAFSDPAKSEGVSLVGDADEGVAKALSVDPATCIRLSASGGKVIGCASDQGVVQILALENLAAIQ